MAQNRRALAAPAAENTLEIDRRAVARYDQQNYRPAFFGPKDQGQSRQVLIDRRWLRLLRSQLAAFEATRQTALILRRFILAACRGGIRQRATPSWRQRRIACREDHENGRNDPHTRRLWG